MRILIVNTSENTGGAAVAANRLMRALNNNGESAKMLVRDKSTGSAAVVGLRHRWLQYWRFLWERLCVYVRCMFSREHLFEIDIANTGADITSLKEFKEADIIHLHWINQGMLSLCGIRRILATGKPVVWTMHDIWPATAICHITHGCNGFKTRCRNCRYLPNKGSGNDLAAKVWGRKQRMLRGHHIHFVACSRWLAGEARKSALLAGQTVASIPNPIDTDVFRPVPPPEEARERIGLPCDKRIILFVSQRATNRNKGMQYLMDACNRLAGQYPEMKDNTCVAILGGHADEVGEMPFESYPLGYTSDTCRIVDVYNACDAFVLPSLSENLPNTIMEAMACGVPCVGFNVGGIPEMIDHRKNGYVARFCDADDLAAGIHWVLFEADYAALARNARQKVVYDYSEKSVAMRYVEVYNHAMAVKKYKL